MNKIKLSSLFFIIFALIISKLKYDLYITTRTSIQNPRVIPIIKNNILIEKYEILETTKESNGKKMIMNITIFKGECTNQIISPLQRSCTPAKHLHLLQDEIFEVYEGVLIYELENMKGILTKGEKMIVKRGFQNLNNRNGPHFLGRK
jgi:hypothetical protein